MKKLTGVLLGMLILHFSGCTPGTIYKQPPPSFTSLNNWPDYYQKNYHRLLTMQSEALISLESPSMAMNFTVEMLYAAPDTLFIQAEGPFGIDVGKFFIGRQRFIIYNQFNNTFITGSLDDKFTSTFLETHLSLREIKNAFIGYSPLPPQLQLVDQQHGIFAAPVNDKKYRYQVNPASGYLESLEIIRENQVLLKEEFKNYTLVEDVIIPRLTRITLPQKKEMVAIYHKNIKINSKIQRDYYAIVIGPKVKQLFITN